MLLRGRGKAVMFQSLAADRIPAGVEPVRRPRLLFVRPGPVEDFHEQIPQIEGLDRPMQQGGGDAETGVVHEPLGGDGDDRDLGVAGVHQGLADQAVIVGGPAHASGLGDGQGHVVGVIPAFGYGVDQLADHQDGGIAGVVVHVL